MYIIVFIIWLTLETSLPALISNQNNINCSDIANNTKQKWFTFTYVVKRPHLLQIALNVLNCLWPSKLVTIQNTALDQQKDITTDIQ
jgi:hypothetical protein